MGVARPGKEGLPNGPGLSATAGADMRARGVGGRRRERAGRVSRAGASGEASWAASLDRAERGGLRRGRWPMVWAVVEWRKRTGVGQASGRGKDWARAGFLGRVRVGFGLGF